MNPRTRKNLDLIIIVLDCCMVAIVLYLAATLFNSYVVFFKGFSHVERFIKYLFLTALLRFVLTLDWGRFLRTRSFTYDFYFVFTFLVVGMCLYLSCFESLHHATRGVYQLSGSFMHATDDEIGNDITNLNQYYPNHKFVTRLKAETPEDARIAFFGDMRGHLFTYELYPRRLYMIPELQAVLNKTAMEAYAWVEFDDPLFPLTDPFHTSIVELDEKVLPEIQDSLRRMIEEKDINFVVYYSTLYPERSFIKRIAD